MHAKEFGLACVIFMYLILSTTTAQCIRVILFHGARAFSQNIYRGEPV